MMKLKLVQTNKVFFKQRNHNFLLDDLTWKNYLCKKYHYVVTAFTSNSLLPSTSCPETLEPWQPSTVFSCPHMGVQISLNTPLRRCPMRLADQYQTDIQCHYLLREQTWHYGIPSPWRQGLPGILCFLLIGAWFTVDGQCR